MLSGSRHLGDKTNMKVSSLINRLIDDDIALFGQRLSHKSVKVYVIMLIGIMGSKSLSLLG